MSRSARSVALVGGLAATVTTLLIAVGSASAAGAAPADGPPCTTHAGALTPVICLPAGSGEDHPAPLGTGDTLEFVAQVVNNGPAVADADVVIVLPAGVRLAAHDPVTRYEDWWSDDFDGDGTALDCATGVDPPTVTCATGALAHGANIVVEIDLVPTDAAVFGTSGALTVGLTAAQGQPEFASTTVGATIDHTGTAHLVVTITPMSVKVTVGQHTDLVGTIHNAGPNPAPNAAAIGLSLPDGDFDDSHFQITNSAPLPDPDGAPLDVQIRPAAAAGASDDSGIGYWPVGTIAPGASAAVTVTVKAVSAGSDQLIFGAGSDAGDPTCAKDGAGCQDAVVADLTAVVVARKSTSPVPTVTRTVTAVATATVTATHRVTHSPKRTTSTSAVAVLATSSPAAAQLARTGFEPGPWLVGAFLVLASGAGLVRAGRRPRRPGPAHR